MSAAAVIGIDPGPVPGICALSLRGGKVVDQAVLQSTDTLTPVVFRALLNTYLWQWQPVVVQIERFVEGPRSAKLRTGSGAASTKRMIDELTYVYEHVETSPGSVLKYVNASAAKAWATDDRLEAAGLYELTVGMRHARDACRHALMAAVQVCGTPDPLSRKA